MKYYIRNVSGPIKSLFEIVFSCVLNPVTEENYGLLMYISTVDLQN